MTDLSCTDYSDKAIVVRGDTKEHKEQLKKLGGKFNANLRDGPGWIFSKKNEEKILSYIASGSIDDDVEENSYKKSKFTGGNLVNTSTLELVAEAIKKMDLKERLTFLSNITNLVCSTPVVSSNKILPSVKPIKKIDDLEESKKQKKSVLRVVSNGDSSDEEESKKQKKSVLRVVSNGDSSDEEESKKQKKSVSNKQVLDCNDIDSDVEIYKPLLSKRLLRQ